MNTHPIFRPGGSLLAFEITSAWITFRSLYKILRSVEGVSDIKRNYFNDNRVTFNYHGESFIVNEPWGDNSRYWVGPENVEISRLNITPLHNAFQEHRSNFRKAWSWLIKLKCLTLRSSGTPQKCGAPQR